MLEKRTLLLRPWEATPAPGRVILDARGGAALGFARWGPVPRFAWLRWLYPSVLAVYESDDEPLLCTVRSFWPLSRCWEVRDADEHAVGTFSRQLIADPYGRVVARVEAGPDGLPGRFLGPADQELATAERGDGGTVLKFTREVEGEPFVKMLLLAATLVLGEP